MKAVLFASVALLLSAAAAYSQGPPAPPVIIGVTPGSQTGTEQIVVTGVVEGAADGKLVMRTDQREYELPPAQYSLLLPHVGEQIQVVGTELNSGLGRRVLVVDHIIISTASDTPRR